jgi:transcription elongation factor GreB
VRIVGVDEARLEAGEVSWISPIARALHKASEGDVVALRTPNGLEEIEVLEIAYRET